MGPLRRMENHERWDLWESYDEAQETEEAIFLQEEDDDDEGD